MIKLFNGACAVLVTSALCTSASAQTINTALDLPKAAVINLMVEKQREQNTGAQAAPAIKATFRYRQAITATATGYTVTQTLTGIDGPAEGRAVLDKVAGMLKVVRFETDESLSPLRLIDRKAVMDAMIETAASLKGEMTADDADNYARAISATRSLYDSMDDTQLAEVVLKEQGSLAQLQGMEMNLSEPMEQVIDTPNPLGGAPVKRTIRVKLDSHDKKAGRASLTMTDVIDPAAMKAAALALLDRVAPEKRQEVLAEFQSAKFEAQTVCKYDMDLKTGLAARTDCTQTSGAIGSDGKAERRVDRTVITQTLEPRP
jgi:hypothetical protein